MNSEKLRTDYIEIEKKIQPFKDFLQKYKDQPEFRDLYKGIITLQSPLVYNPEILFLGINPGDGAYYEKNHKSPGTHYIPLRTIGEDERFSKELNWFEKGNARASEENGKSIKYEWYQRDKKAKNYFPKQMIDILYEVAKLKFPEEGEKKNSDHKNLPFWYEGFGKKIMYTNLYPIATTNTSDLKAIFSLLSKAPEIKALVGNTNKNDPWQVQLYFIKIIEELVELVKPKLIVCAGTSAFNDFTFTNGKKSGKVFKEKKGNYDVIGFSRNRNWSGSIPEIAKTIVENQQETVF